MFLSYPASLFFRMAKPAKPAHPLVPAQRRLFLLGFALVMAIAGADWLLIDTARSSAIAAFQTAATNLARGMAAQTAFRLESVDGLLQGLAGNISPHSGPSHKGEGEGEALAQACARASGVEGFAVAGADGTITAACGAGGPTGRNISQTDVFRHFAHASDYTPYFGAPERAASGSWTSALGRRLAGPDGRFLGVVLADISLDDLQRFYQVAMPPGRALLVARMDGTVLVRYPKLEHVTGTRLPQATPLFAAAASGGSAYLTAGYFHNVPMVAAARRLNNMMPLVVEASVSQAETLAGFRSQLPWMIAAGVAVCLGVIWLLRLFGRQIGRLARKNLLLDEARQQLNAAMCNISLGLCFFDGEHRLIVCNPRFAEMYGLSPDLDRPGTRLADMVSRLYENGGVAGVSAQAYLESCKAIASTGLAYRAVTELADGRTISVQQQPMPDGGWVATHEDITERRQAEDQITFLARHDVLTGLPNRALLMERMIQARVGALRGIGFAVLFLDLDRFKTVNDTMGHAAGDELLKAVAERLSASVREGDMVARLGGDEFVILQANIANPSGAAVLAGRIIPALSKPYAIAGNEVSIGVSIGIDIATKDHASPEDLMKNADMALYTAKAEGRGTFRFFEPMMDAAVQGRAALERDLRCALSRDQFELYYQPVIHAQSEEICGFEALIRWNHPERGLVPPGEFISAAEECGLIIEIGAWVIRQACLQAARWPSRIHVAANLSPVQFRAANLVETVRDALRVSGLAPERLELEITESVLLQSNERNMAVMHELRALGIAIAMDDFGTGYSSLSYLRRFPFDRIKIDRSFVNDLRTRDDAIYVVRAIVGLCQNFGIRTTAEGVEDKEQLAILRAEGCTELQGYFFSRPRPAAYFGTLAEREAEQVEEMYDVAI